MPKTSDVGVIVGRFQVHRLHEAHESLIRSVYESHRHTVVVLGLSPARLSRNNPLDFEARKQMLLAAFPQLTVFYLKDEPDDARWSLKLDALLRDYLSPSQSACLYGGRDSFIARYSGGFPTEVLEPSTYASGTDIRKAVSKAVKGSEDFRAGVVWATANGYPRVFPTVDIAVYRFAGKTDVGPPFKEWLLVRKPTEKLWRFPGGFVDPGDHSLEDAARRELREETGVLVQVPRYVWSGLVDDWRYRGEADQIMTTLFMAAFSEGPVRPADDVAEAKWLKIGNELDFVPEHRPLQQQIIATGAWS